MPVRAVLNFVYVYLRPKGDGVTQEDIEKWDAELYADPGDEALRLSLINRLGG
jgi:hypothetical protein